MKRIIEIALVVAALGLGAYLVRRGRPAVAVPEASTDAPAPPMQAAATDSEFPDRPVPAPKAGSVTFIPAIKMTSPPKPAKRSAPAVPAPESR